MLLPNLCRCSEGNAVLMYYYYYYCSALGRQVLTPQKLFFLTRACRRNQEGAFYYC